MPKIDYSDSKIHIGSSRGMQHQHEHEWGVFHSKGSSSRLASPRTTAGGLATFLAKDLACFAGAQSYSAACNSAMVALGAAFAEHKAGLQSKAIVGGVDIPGTPFFSSAMRRLGVISKQGQTFPFGLDRDGMVLSEGGVLLLTGNYHDLKPLGEVLGYGTAGENTSLAGVHPQGLAVQSALKKAIEVAGIYPEQVDLVLAHGTGTQAGDASEAFALKRVFHHGPEILAPKARFGHALGASSLIGLADLLKTKEPGHSGRVLALLSQGFGGVACAAIVKISEY